jgi:hypothetical protein
MGYAAQVTINGFPIEYGRMNMSNSFGVYLNFEDDLIKKAILDSEPLLLSAIKEVLSLSEEIDALYVFKHFNYYLENGSWSRITENYSFVALNKFLKQAEIVLKSQSIDEVAKKNAQCLIDILNGNPPPSKELTEVEKKQRKFQKTRNKLFKQLIERDGYECHVCKTASDLRVSHEISLTKGGESEMNNLRLKCRKCVNKR